MHQRREEAVEEQIQEEAHKLQVDHPERAQGQIEDWAQIEDSCSQLTLVVARA